MNLNKDIIENIKKLGFKPYKDFHSGLYILDRGGEILPSIQIYEIDAGIARGTISIDISFNIRRTEGFIHFIDCGLSASCQYGYDTLKSYKLIGKGEIVYAHSEESKQFFGWRESDKEELIYYLDHQLMEFVTQMIDKERFFSVNLENLGANGQIVYYEDQGNTNKIINILISEVEYYKHWTDISSLRRKAYLEYLKNGIPLPDIKDPDAQASFFQLAGNDIYIAVNKKTIKDNTILELFGGTDIFSKAQKSNYDENLSDDGLTIGKLGKWTVIRCGLEIFANTDQEKMNGILTKLSSEYNRAILFINQDTSGTFGFEIHQKGTAIRKWMSGDGKVIINEGKAVSGEKKRFGDSLKKEQDEQSVQEFLDDTLKITYSDLEKCKSSFYGLK